MASITKSSKGYRAQVYVRGQRDSASFPTRREAVNWAAQRENELRDNRPAGERHTLIDALRRYGEEVTPHKRGRQWEYLRIESMTRNPDLPINLPISELTPEHFAAYRNSRLKQVAPGTVLREFSFLSAVLETARREWRWLPSNPIRDVKKPAEPDHREVIITRPQIKAMLRSMGYRKGECKGVAQAVAHAFLFALRTGMRAGEICALKWSDVYPGYCRIRATDIGAGKTGKRDVPLTPKAERIIADMRGYDPEFVMGIKSTSLDANFRKYRQRAGLEGFTFHDSRHTAATWMAQKIHALDLCKVMGWKNASQALTYYNPKAEDIAMRLVAGQSR